MFRNPFFLAAALGAACLSSGSAFAHTGAVKLECSIGNCSSASLGQVCDTYVVNSRPLAIACEVVADPGRGIRRACGSGAFCTPYGTLVRSDIVDAYCADTAGNDVIVTCTTEGATADGIIASEEDAPGADQKTDDKGDQKE